MLHTIYLPHAVPLMLLSCTGSAQGACDEGFSGSKASSLAVKAKASSWEKLKPGARLRAKAPATHFSNSRSNATCHSLAKADIKFFLFFCSQSSRCSLQRGGEPCYYGKWKVIEIVSGQAMTSPTPAGYIYRDWR